MAERGLIVTLRAIRGAEGIKKCLEAGNDAPLHLVMSDLNDYVNRLVREMSYPHWTEDQKHVFKLCLKWLGVDQ